ncbi:MAG: TA system antitoxin ParD family protein [Neisseriaceae bacterium]|jgi:hypothetical protein
MEKKSGKTVRHSDELYEQARHVATLNHRSVAAQIEYWAHLGIAIEGKLSQDEILNLLEEYRDMIKSKRRS